MHGCGHWAYLLEIIKLWYDALLNLFYCTEIFKLRRSEQQWDCSSSLHHICTMLLWFVLFYFTKLAPHCVYQSSVTPSHCHPQIRYRGPLPSTNICVSFTIIKISDCGFRISHPNRIRNSTAVWITKFCWTLFSPKAHSASGNFSSDQVTVLYQTVMVVTKYNRPHQKKFGYSLLTSSPFWIITWQQAVPFLAEIRQGVVGLSSSGNLSS